MENRSGMRRRWLSIAVAVFGLCAPCMVWGAAVAPKLDIRIPDSARHLHGNKKIVFDTWQDFQHGDIEAGLANMTDDVTWQAPGANKLAGVKRGKDALRNFRSKELTLFTELHHQVVGIYGDGDTVILELSSWGRLVNGQPYDNAGVTVWEVENGKIKHVRQYVDTYKAMALNALLKDQSPPSGSVKTPP